VSPPSGGLAHRSSRRHAPRRPARAGTGFPPQNKRDDDPQGRRLIQHQQQHPGGAAPLPVRHRFVPATRQDPGKSTPAPPRSRPARRVVPPPAPRASMTRTRAGLDRQLPSRASTNQTGPAWMLAAFQRGLSSPPEMPRALYAPHFSSSEPGAARGVVALAAELPVRPLAVDCSTDGTAIAIAATAAALPAPTRRRVQTPPLPRSGEQIPRRVLGRGQHRCPHAAAGCEAACNVTGMAGAAGMSDWRGMELGAPEIARLGTARLAAARVAMLARCARTDRRASAPSSPTS
jgi:hypothetical protein